MIVTSKFDKYNNKSIEKTTENRVIFICYKFFAFSLNKNAHKTCFFPYNVIIK